MNIGETLKSFRILKGYTAKELADKACIAQSSISGIENNKTSPSIDTFKKILDALEITFTDFFNELPAEYSPDFLQLIEAAKKLTPEERMVLTEFINLAFKREK
jgi:transcriptional regulator with XRE-family HTH domain